MSNRSRSRSPRRRPRKNVRKTNNSWQPTPNSRLTKPGGNVIVRSIERLVDQGEVTATSLAPGVYGLAFTLQDLTDYSQWTSVFDQYCITKVECQIFATTLLPSPSSVATYSYGFVAVDYDDNAVPASVQVVQSYSNAMILKPGRDLTFSLVPRYAGTAVTTYGGAVGPATIQRGWLDCGYPQVPHYGLKIAIQQSTSTNMTRWRVLFRYHVSFRSSR